MGLLPALRERAALLAVFAAGADGAAAVLSVPGFGGRVGVCVCGGLDEGGYDGFRWGGGGEGWECGWGGGCDVRGSEREVCGNGCRGRVLWIRLI